jgi:NADPH2:quinone reductase
MVLFGQASGAVAPIDPQVLNRRGSIYLTRPSIGHYTRTREELMLRAADVLGWVAAGRLTVRIFRELPLADAAEAHRLLESRRMMGKLLLMT